MGWGAENSENNRVVQSAQPQRIKINDSKLAITSYELVITIQVL